ncbi:Gfo/Idh/MocA family protein [Paracoccus aestuariivivens]|uniref:Gfo/Idh/MocA family oxidoreductase n=1 Tax=Paracoccus aestuariivivens TaxID=1820333 RepID=A0A6L6J814_9RHOB|nr:Gfo/Idh/MocA family oxidoreductase [Paracoccus aestuariivivens]MTH78090.1 gfo/Idh/MocA family oxidoreductase [Paracoccus aestuariivivens]
MDKLNIGIIGAGNISATYFELSPLFKRLNITSVADLNLPLARKAAEAWQVIAQTPEDMLADPSIDLIVNLTVPAAHYPVSKAALLAGKHVYSEKPFVLSLAEGQELAEIASAKGLRLGSAPDTFLGGSHQQARALIDAGAIGRVHSATAHVMSPGMEHWHPNPDFFFLPGGGPILDLGPYYITNFVSLLGPVARVTALTGMASTERVIGSEPRAGERIPVKTPTTIHALLQFASGAMVTMGASWDVHGHKHGNMEIYGSEGSLILPDPNFFGGSLELAKRGEKLAEVQMWDHPFAIPNQSQNGTPRANYRAAGLADMARAICEGGDFLCDQSRALHVIEVMTAILQAGESGSWVTLTTTCDRPAALDPEAARELLVQDQAVPHRGKPLAIHASE